MHLLAGLDVGSSKIVCLIAERQPCGRRIRIKSFSCVLSKGFSAGRVTSFFDAVESLRRSVAEAEEKIGVRVRGVFVHCAFEQTLSQLVYVRRPVSGLVTEEDVVQVDAFARSRVKSGEGWGVIHTGPVAYFLDGDKMVRDPCHTRASELGVLLHATLVPQKVLMALRKCLNQAHLEMLGIIPSPYANAEEFCSGCDTPDEDVRIHVDMGDASTNAAIFYAGMPTSLCTVPSGGAHLTEKITRRLRCSWSEANVLKLTGINHSALWRECRVHVQETFSLLRRHLVSDPFYPMTLRGKIVLTGAGGRIPSAPGLLQEMFPQHTVLTPIHLNHARVCVGLDGCEQDADSSLLSPAAGAILSFLSVTDTINNGRGGRSRRAPGSVGPTRRVWRWLKEHF